MVHAAAYILVTCFFLFKNIYGIYFFPTENVKGKGKKRKRDDDSDDDDDKKKKKKTTKHTPKDTAEERVRKEMEKVMYKKDGQILDKINLLITYRFCHF